MIDRSALPSIPDTLRRLDIAPGRHRRARCPVHRGDNPTALSWTEEGQWFCHRCGIGGDVITLAQRALDLDCAGAMRWLGIAPGKPPIPDPAVLHRQRIREGLRTWADSRARELRYEHYVMERVTAGAERRLRQDPEDEMAWRWLAWTAGQDRIAHELDMLEADESQQIEVYQHKRRVI